MKVGIEPTKHGVFQTLHKMPFRDCALSTDHLRGAVRDANPRPSLCRYQEGLTRITEKWKKGLCVNHTVLGRGGKEGGVLATVMAPEESGIEDIRKASIAKYHIYATEGSPEF